MIREISKIVFLFDLGTIFLKRKYYYELMNANLERLIFLAVSIQDILRERLCLSITMNRKTVMGTPVTGQVLNTM
jgi:hypothetical protein